MTITATMISSYPIEEVIRGHLGTIKFLKDGFEIIKEELRGEMALQYLRQTKIPLGQLSALLGFPEQSAFTT